MKKLFSLAVLFFAFGAVSAQSESDFSRYSKDVNAYAQLNPDATRTILCRQFDVYGTHVDMLLNKLDGDWGGVASALAIGQVTNNFPQDVWTAIQEHGYKGWPAVARSLGVDRNSFEHHALSELLKDSAHLWRWMAKTTIDPMTVEVIKVKYEK